MGVHYAWVCMDVYGCVWMRASSPYFPCMLCVLAARDKGGDRDACFLELLGMMPIQQQIAFYCTLKQKSTPSTTSSVLLHKPASKQNNSLRVQTTREHFHLHATGSAIKITGITKGAIEQTNRSSTESAIEDTVDDDRRRTKCVQKRESRACVPSSVTAPTWTARSTAPD